MRLLPRHWILGLVVVSFVGFGSGLLVGSKRYWGYAFSIPSSATTAAEFASLDRFSGYKGSLEVGVSGPEFLQRVASRVNWRSGDSPSGRFAAALIDRGLSPVSAESVPANLPALIHTALDEAGLLEPRTGNYGMGWGLIATGTSVDDSPLIAAAISNGPVSNDHHPYYEAVFERWLSGEWRLVRFQRYYYDIAGLEGAGVLVGIEDGIQFATLAFFGWCACIGAWILVALASRVLLSTKQLEEQDL